MSALFRRFFKTAIFSRFLKVAIATSNFMTAICNGGFAQEFSVSMLQETIKLVRDCEIICKNIIWHRVLC